MNPFFLAVFCGIKWLKTTIFYLKVCHLKIVSKSKDTCLSFKVESVKGYRKLRGREEQKLIQFGLITFKTVKDQITKHFFFN